MPNDEKIDVRTGGTITGTTFKWKNGHGKQTTATGLSACLTANSYPVPGSQNGKDGELPATVNGDPAPSCTYQWSDDSPTATAGTATLTVSRSPMK
jgi:hypothetical protein